MSPEGANMNRPQVTAAPKVQGNLGTHAPQKAPSPRGANIANPSPSPIPEPFNILIAMLFAPCKITLLKAIPSPSKMGHDVGAVPG